MYLIFEGVDTSGKTTQINLLQEELQDIIITKEPGGTELGKKLREMILFEGVGSYKTELFLFLADRAEHYEQVIKPQRDKTIISDRGFISGIAYAMANHEEYKMDFLIALNRFALDEQMPDGVVLLKTNETLIRERLGKKKEDMIEKRGIEYLLKVQKIMEEILDILEINHIIIHSSKSISEINKEIKGFIND